MSYGCARTGRLTGRTIDMRILSLFTAPSKIPLERPALGIADGSLDPKPGGPMRPTRSLFLLILTASFTLLSNVGLAPTSLAQIPSASDTTSTPVPGAGHRRRRCVA